MRQSMCSSFSGLQIISAHQRRAHWVGVLFRLLDRTVSIQGSIQYFAVYWSNSGKGQRI